MEKMQTKKKREGKRRDHYLKMAKIHGKDINIAREEKGIIEKKQIISSARSDQRDRYT